MSPANCTGSINTGSFSTDVKACLAIAICLPSGTLLWTISFPLHFSHCLGCHCSHQRNFTITFTCNSFSGTDAAHCITDVELRPAPK
jgi:hypothetical protein